MSWHGLRAQDGKPRQVLSKSAVRRRPSVVVIWLRSLTRPTIYVSVGVNSGMVINVGHHSWTTCRHLWQPCRLQSAQERSDRHCSTARSDSY